MAGYPIQGHFHPFVSLSLLFFNDIFSYSMHMCKGSSSWSSVIVVKGRQVTAVLSIREER